MAFRPYLPDYRRHAAGKVRKPLRRDEIGYWSSDKIWDNQIKLISQTLVAGMFACQKQEARDALYPRDGQHNTGGMV